MRLGIRDSGIVGNLLSFARQQPKSVKKVAIHPILEDILSQVKHHVSLEGIEVRWEPPADEIALEADEDQLRQVFTNLIINAVQAMGKGGVLTINTSIDSDSCRIEIRDTGTGIPQEQVKDLFTPFYTTKQSGTGLGLSVSYGIVKNHGGTISVRSEPGAGAVFVVTLPLARRGRSS